VLSNPITEPQIPGAIARDTETAAAIAGHEAKTNPHSAAKYLTQEAADARYRLNSTSAPIFTAAPLPTANIAGNTLGFGWNSVQSGQGIAELCNYSGTGGGDAFNFFRLPGNPVSSPSLSNRVARIDISGAYVQTSDKRLKSNFHPAPGLETLMRLTPLKYTHWGCVGFDQKNKTLKIGEFAIDKLGFFAQDVQKVIPEAVSIPSSPEEIWGIDYNCILACAVQSIKELKAKIDELKAKIDELKAKIDELKAKII
jgi:hypothetical protein